MLERKILQINYGNLLFIFDLHSKDPRRPRLLVDDVLLYADGTQLDPWKMGVLCKVRVDPNGDIFVVKDMETKLLKHLPLTKLAYISPPKEAVLKVKMIDRLFNFSKNISMIFPFRLLTEL